MSETTHVCRICGAETYTCCFGGHRCEECDPPCPGCYDGGMDAHSDDDDEDNEGTDCEGEDDGEGEEDTPDQDEPDEEDLFTEDHATFWYCGKPVIRVSDREDWRDVVRQWMDTEGFYPNVWFVSDHGNAHLITPALGNSENNGPDSVEGKEIEQPDLPF